MQARAPYAALRLVCLYFSATPDSAACVYGRVCRRWRDVVCHHCDEMWAAFYRRAWPNEFTRQVHRTFYAFAARAQLLGLAKPGTPFRDASALDIENCAAEFAFRCPMLASNLERTSDFTTSGMPVLFCHVCERRVYPVERQDELAAAIDGDRCVYMSPRTLLELRRDAALSEPDVNVALVANDDDTETVRCLQLMMPGLLEGHFNVQVRAWLLTRELLEVTMITSPRRWKFHVMPSTSTLEERHTREWRLGLRVAVRRHGTLDAAARFPAARVAASRSRASHPLPRRAALENVLRTTIAHRVTCH